MPDRLVVTAVSAALLLAACGTGSSSTDRDGGNRQATETRTRTSTNTSAGDTTAPTATERPSFAAPSEFPAVLKVEVSHDADGYDFRVTITSPYASAQRYADAFRVRSQTGVVFGVRELEHPHSEPFTRTLENVRVPDGVTEVVVEGRDSVNGWGGKTRVVELPA